MTLLPTESLRLLLQTDANSFSSIDEFVNAAVASLADALSKRRPHFDPEVDENLNVFACSCGGILVEPVTFTDGSSICKLCSMNQTADGRVPAGMRETGESSTAVALPAPCVMLSNVVKKHFEAHIDAVRLRVEGEEALNVGDCTKAIDLYTTALRIVGDDLVLLLNRSQAFASLRCFAEALADADKAISINPRYSKSHYIKGQALDGMGLLDEASASYLACLVLEQDNVAVQKRLQKILKTVLLTEVERSISSDVIDRIVGIATLCQQDLSKTKTLKTAFAIPDKLSREDFLCALCCKLIFEPTTTPCGHTFCCSCLNRSLDHRPTCPACRTSLTDYLADVVKKTHEQPSTDALRLPETTALKLIIQHYFSEKYEVRRKQTSDELQQVAGVAAEQEVIDEASLPIFVCTAAFPTVWCPLHIFEPRYRLMIRRCIESGSLQFGMCEPAEGEPFADVGTVLNIRKIEFLSDGRSVIDTIGGRRFRVISRGITDGYNRAIVQYISDNRVTNSQEKEELKVLCNEVYAATQIWFASLPALLKDRVVRSRGMVPEFSAIEDPGAVIDGPDWVWWVFGVFQGQFDASRVLGSSSLGERLRILRQVIDEERRLRTAQLCRPQ